LSRKKNIANSRLSKTGARQEPKASRKRIPDDALLFTARAPINKGMPPLISYVGQQSRGIGESNRQLQKQVMYRNSRAAAMSRAVHLPVLSKVFDFVQRTAAFFTPVYQRVLDLPWFRRRHKPGRTSIQTKGGTADRQRYTTNQQLNELHPNMLLQTSHDIEEEQVGREAGETQDTEEAFSMTNITPLSPLLMREKAATGAHDFPHVVSPIGLPRYTRKMSVQYDQNVPKQPSRLTAIEQPTRRENKTPKVIENILTPPAAGMNLLDTDSEAYRYAPSTHVRPNNKQITYSLESEGDDKPTYPHAGQSDTTAPAIHEPCDIREPVHMPARAIEGVPLKVYRQPYHKYGIPTLSPLLMPVTQRINLHQFINSKSIKAGSQTIGEGIKQTKSSSIYIGTLDEPIGQTVHTSHLLAFAQQPATLKPKSVLQASPCYNGPATSKGTLGRTTPLKPSIIARYPDEMASSTLLPEALTQKEGTEMPTGGISRHSVHQTRQARRQMSLFTSRADLLGDKTDAVCQTEGMVEDNKSKDTVETSSPEQSRTGLGFIRGRINKLLLYSQPLSIAGSLLQLSPDHKRIHSAETSPTGTYDFAFNREDVSSYPNVKNAYQQPPELVLSSLLQEKAESNTSYRKEVLKGTPDIFPELMYSRKQNVPELERAAISRIPEIQTQPAEPEPQEAGSSEMAKDDLENIARDVYHILKRRLARERERALGVI
jgi:hypothetical protein